MTDTSLEHAYIRPPFEAASKYCRNAQKLVDREFGDLESARGSVAKVAKSVAKLVKLKRKQREALEASEDLPSSSSSSSSSSSAAAAAAASSVDADGDVAMSDLVRLQAAQKKRKKQKLEAAKATKTTVKAVDGLLKRVKTLRKKLVESDRQATKYLKRAEVRVQHLVDMEQAEQEAQVNTDDVGGTDSARMVVLHKLRQDRMVVDYLLRHEMYESAKELAATAGIRDHVDLEVFATAKHVVEGLRARDCSRLLAWCGANRSRLTRLFPPDSSGERPTQSFHVILEFYCRLQAFVELVRKGEVIAAIEHAREHLTGYYRSTPGQSNGLHFEEQERAAQIRHAMASLAFVSTGTWGPCADLFDEARWTQLEGTFKDALFLASGLTRQSILEAHMQVGISALKTLRCGINTVSASPAAPCRPDGSSCNGLCPVCQPLLGPLATTLPAARRTQSSIVCRISGEILDERNPPMTLPNGQVYSRRALEKMAERDDGYVRCPVTGDRAHLSECMATYVL